MLLEWPKCMIILHVTVSETYQQSDITICMYKVFGDWYLNSQMNLLSAQNNYLFLTPRILTVNM